jgi:methionine--tRNA ligase beta chain
MKVGADSVIELDFTARLLPEDEIVESTRGREVLVVHLGRLEVAPGLERALLGMGVGEEKSIELGPEEGYGPVHREAIHRRRRSEFPPGAELKAGMRLAGRLKDSDQRVEFGIREVTDDEVVIDFNHPFAGRRLRYWLLVRSVRQPTAEEREETRRMAEARGRTGDEAQRDGGMSGPGAPPLVSIEDVMRLGLKVGRVTEAVRVAGTDRLLQLTVDLGGETRTIVAGIAAKYPPEVLAGRSIIVVTNLKPATIRGIESRGMLLAGVGEGGQPIVATFDEPVPPGAQVR